MTGTPNGTSSTLAGCYPYYPISAQGQGGYVCLPAMQEGVRVDSTDPGQCTYNGFAYRPLKVITTQGECVRSADVVPGDVTASSGESYGAAVCSTAGYGSTATTINGTSYTSCSGTKAPLPVSDSATQTKVDAATSAVQSFASANHTDLGSVKSAVTAGTGASTETAPAETFSVQPVMTALFAPVLVALLAVLLWSFWKQLAR